MVWSHNEKILMMYLLITNSFSLKKMLIDWLEFCGLIMNYILFIYLF